MSNDLFIVFCLRDLNILLTVYFSLFPVKLLHHRTLAFCLAQRRQLLRSQNLTEPVADFVQRFKLCLHLFQLPGKDGLSLFPTDLQRLVMDKLLLLANRDDTLYPGNGLHPLFGFSHSSIGPADTGKMHLSQTFGYACCQHGLKTNFIKASELLNRFTAARRSEKTDTRLNSLVQPSCLIIDEIGYCASDKENTRLFFDMINWRYNISIMIFTSNKNLALRRADFEENDTLLCTLGRISYNATVFKLRK